MAEQYAPRLALIAVWTAVVRGILSGGDFGGTVQAGAVAALVFYLLGLLIGEIAGRLIKEHVRAATSSPGARATATGLHGPT